MADYWRWTSDETGMDDEAQLFGAFYAALDLSRKDLPGPLTPGEIAYAAYWGVRQMPECRTWADLPHYQQFAWEAAAQAVLEAFVSSAQPLPHWGEPHVTDGTPCFCGAREEDGVVIHRRMPWEQPGQREGEA